MYPLFLSDFYETWIFWEIFDKQANIKFHENLPVEAEMFLVGGHTDKHDGANSRFSKFYERA